jgi:hypothetical protein
VYQRELNIGKTVLLWQRWDEVRKVRDVSIVGVRQGVPDQHHPNPTRNGGMVFCLTLAAGGMLRQE